MHYLNPTNRVLACLNSMMTMTAGGKDGRGGGTTDVQDFEKLQREYRHMELERRVRNGQWLQRAKAY